MTDDASTVGDALAETPAPPRHARDVRVTGRAGAPEALGSHWAGVGRPFGGVLAPGLASGEWPPPVLAHLSLGALLADALDPTAGRATEGRSRRSTDPQPGPSEPAGEPTVREVLRTEPASASPVDDATSALPERRAPDHTTAPSAADPPDEPATGPSRDGEAGSDPVAPRTVLRQVGAWRDPPPGTTERWIARLAESDEPAAGGETGGAAAPDSPSADGRAGSPAVETRGPSIPSIETAPPVDRTVAAPASSGGGAGSDAVGPSDSSGAASEPAADRAGSASRAVEPGRPTTRDPDGSSGEEPDGRRRAGDAVESAADAGPGGDPAAPAMTVRRGLTDSTGEDGRRSRGANRAAGIETGGPDASTSAEPAGRPDAPESRATADSNASDPGARGATHGSGRGAVAGDAIEGSVAEAVTDPRVVDRLHRELERRRRIERERGGRP